MASMALGRGAQAASPGVAASPSEGAPPAPAVATEEAPASPEVVNPALPDGAWELTLGGGIERDPVDVDLHIIFALNYAITDRLAWAAPLPAFSYRWGESGSAELIARGGLTGLGYSSIDGWVGIFDAAMTGQVWLSPALSAVLQASAEWDFQTQRRANVPSRSDDLPLRGSVGLSWRPVQAITLSAAAGVTHEVEVREADVSYARRSELTFGSTQALGYRPLPLVRVYLSPTFSLDGYAVWAVSLRQRIPNRQWYAGGFTWQF